MNKKPLVMSAVAASVALLLFSIMSMVSTSRTLFGVKGLQAPEPLSASMRQSIQKALSIEVQQPEFIQLGEWDSPFRALDVKDIQFSGEVMAELGAQSQYRRPVLTVVGILKGTNPYAVFQSEQGQTVIGARGEVVLGQKVVAIARDTVTLVDSLGSYKLVFH